MVDESRVLAKIDELDGYLKELRGVTPAEFSRYQRTEIKRSCERLLQLSVECTIDICKLMVSGLRSGLPADENDLFDKLRNEDVIPEETARLLKEMRGLRNILVHEYADINDELVFEKATTKLTDFARFKEGILNYLKR